MALFFSLGILPVKRVPLCFVGAGGVIRGDDAGEGAAGRNQEGLELRRELVEEVEASVRNDYEATCDGEAAEPA